MIIRFSLSFKVDNHNFPSFYFLNVRDFFSPFPGRYGDFNQTHPGKHTADIPNLSANRTQCLSHEVGKMKLQLAGAQGKLH